MTLQVKKITGTWNRGIVVGDLHGCVKELKTILRKVNFSNSVTRSCPSVLEDFHDPNTLTEYTKGANEGQQGTDDLCIFVGDIVNKGPDSYGCARLLRALGAVGVVGNHDLKLLSIRKHPEKDEHIKSSLYSLAMNCPQDVLDYLESLPHIIHFPNFNALVVHAGLDPTVPLANQDVEAVTRMRRLQKKNENSESGDEDILSSSDYYHTIEKGKKGKKWFKVWQEVVHEGSNELPCAEEIYKKNIVVYGHDAKSSLQEKKFTIGLDSGCVYGRSLSALVLPSRKIVQVPGYQQHL